MKLRNFIIGSTILLFVYSCSKESEEEVDTSQSAFETEASILSEEIEKSADAVTFEKNLIGSNQNGPFNCSLPDCATITVEYPEGGSFPKVVTVDYGEENCQVRPNLSKRGKVIINISDSMNVMNAQRSITFDSFYINDQMVSGEKILSNIGVDEDGHVVFDIDNDFSVGDWTRVTTGTKTWIEGFDSNDYSDNIFLLEGSSITSRANGLEISRIIISPLRVDRSCGYITEGVLNIEWNENLASIDFGDGSCDDNATITRNEQEFEIDLDDFRCRRRIN